MGLLNTVTPMNKKYIISRCASTGLIPDVMGAGDFSYTNHLLELREERCHGQKIRDDVNNAKLEELVKYLDGTDRCLILDSKNIGDCLSIRGTAVTITVLSATKFCHFNAQVMMLPP